MKPLTAHNSVPMRKSCSLVGCDCAEFTLAPQIANMVRAWRDLDRRIASEEITTTKAAELFVAEFGK